MTHSSPAAVGTIGPGDHTCFVFDSDEARVGALAAVARLGFRQDDKVIYLVDDRTRRQVLDRLSADGVEPGPFLASGQLRLDTSESLYGDFDPDRTVAQVASEAELARSEGYRALRITGDITAALRELAGPDGLRYYEERINDTVHEHDIVGICRYDRREFCDEALDEARAVHGDTIEDLSAEVLFTSPLASVLRDGSGLRLVGDIDLSNADATGAVLREMAEVDGDVTLDMSAVGFIDVRGLRHLELAAKTLREHGRRLVLRAPSPTLLDILAKLEVAELIEVVPGDAGQSPA